MVFLVFMLVLIIAILLYLALKYQRMNTVYKENHKVVEAADEYYHKKILEANVYYDEIVNDAKKYSEDKVSHANQYVAEQERRLNSLKIENKRLKEDIESLNATYLAESVYFDEYSGMTSAEIKDKLALLQSKQKQMIKEGSAYTVSSSEKKGVVNKQIQQLMHCYNLESAEIIGKATAKNHDRSRNSLTRTFDSVNKLFAVDGVQISRPYFDTKLKELNYVCSYMKRLEEEAEEKRIRQEQLRQDAKAREELKLAEQKIDKDMKQVNNEVNKLMKYMQKAHDDVERQLYLDKIQELEARIKELEASKEDVVNRAQNAKAGFVYIISNIGSFGEDVYKIGMTRRLEPMDRIRELSSASVPFVFDVHALIFSNDAPALEATLHQYFDSKRVNKVNPRKEFYKVDLEEIKQVVLENHNATVNFVDIPDATEYRETLAFEAKSKPVEVTYSEKNSTNTQIESHRKPVKARPVKVKQKSISNNMPSRV